MAQTTVTLKVKDFEEREVMYLDYKFEQQTDVDGQPNSLPRGGRIVAKVKAMNDGNSQLLAWMLADADGRDIEVVFQKPLDNTPMKTLTGTKCYLTKYEEAWEEGVGHHELIEIVCKELKNGGVAFENKWK